jgi:hypothetical protein
VTDDRVDHCQLLAKGRGPVRALPRVRGLDGGVSDGAGRELKDLMPLIAYRVWAVGNVDIVKECEKLLA